VSGKIRRAELRRQAAPRGAAPDRANSE
jgi:hypothetical protein